MFERLAPNFGATGKSQILQLQEKMSPWRYTRYTLHQSNALQLMKRSGPRETLEWNGPSTYIDHACSCTDISTFYQLLHTIYIYIWYNVFGRVISAAHVSAPRKSLVATSSSSIWRTKTIAAPVQRIAMDCNGLERTTPSMTQASGTFRNLTVR